MNQRSYRYDYGGGSHPTKFVGVLYDEMYRARNDFMHGNPVTERNLRFRRSRRFAPLWLIAPVVFNSGLRAYMKSMFAMSDTDFRDDAFFGRIAIRDALLNIRGGRQDRRR